MAPSSDVLRVRSDWAKQSANVMGVTWQWLLESVMFCRKNESE